MLIAIDVGLKRIGIAQYAAGVALPLDPILRKNRNQAARNLDLLLEEKKAQALIVGLPLEGGSSEEMQRRIHHFTSLLAFKGQVIYVDEAYSSKEAQERIKGIHKERREGKLDSLSALIILERYLGSL